MAKKNTKSQAAEYSDSLDGGMPMDEPGSSRTRGPVLVWNADKDRALAYVVRNPDSEDGDTIDEITDRLKTVSLNDIDSEKYDSTEPVFGADVDSGALTPAKVQLRRQQLIKRGLVAPELRRRAFTRYTPKVDELNAL